MTKPPATPPAVTPPVPATPPVDVPGLVLQVRDLHDNLASLSAFVNGLARGLDTRAASAEERITATETRIAEFEARLGTIAFAVGRNERRIVDLEAKVARLRIALEQRGLPPTERGAS